MARKALGDSLKINNLILEVLRPEIRYLNWYDSKVLQTNGFEILVRWICGRNEFGKL